MMHCDTSRNRYQVAIMSHIFDTNPPVRDTVERLGLNPDDVIRIYLTKFLPHCYGLIVIYVHCVGFLLKSSLMPSVATLDSLRIRWFCCNDWPDFSRWACASQPACIWNDEPQPATRYDTDTIITATEIRILLTPRG